MRTTIHAAIMCSMLTWSLGLNAQADLSGKWTGDLIVGGDREPYEMHLGRSGPDLFIGIARVKQFQNGRREKQERLLVGGWRNGQFLLSEIGGVPPGSDPASSTKGWKFKNFVLTGSGDKLTGKNLVRGVGEGKTDLTREGDAEPVLLAKASAALQRISIDAGGYKSEKGNDVIGEKDFGKVRYLLKNGTNMRLNQLMATLKAVNDAKGVFKIDQSQTQSFVRSIGGGWLDPASTTDQGIELSSGFGLPADSARFHLDMETTLGIVVAQKVIAIPTTNRSAAAGSGSNATSFDWNANERVKLIGAYYGIGTYRWDVHKELDKLTDAGDHKARIWKALLMHLGQGGYETDEQMAFSCGSRAGAIAKLAEEAEAGDVESRFLHVAVLLMELAGSHRQEELEARIVEAAGSGYGPAQYLLGVKRLKEKKYVDARYNFQKALESGVKLAEVQLGLIEENGWGLPKDAPKAVGRYQKTADMGCPDALLRLAALHSEGSGVPKDDAQALQLLERCKSMGCTRGMLALADHYIRTGTQKARILPLTKQAADLGNRDALFQLALLHGYPEMCGAPKNDSLVIRYLKSAAMAGEPHAMNQLGLRYSTGTGVEPDGFLGRFWLSEGARRGVGEGVKDNVSFGEPLLAFLGGVCSYQPDIIVETRYYSHGGSTTSTYDDPNPLPYMVNGAIEMYKELHQQRQPTINEFRMVYKRGDVSTHAGILTSGVSIKLRATDVVNVQVSGTVNFGMFAGTSGPEGVNNSDMIYYNLVRNQPHGSVIASGNGGDSWGRIGYSATGLRIASGELTIAVNDIDYTNNQGYFDLRVDIFDTVRPD